MRSVQKVLKSLAWITRRLESPLRSERTTIVLTIKSKERLSSVCGAIEISKTDG